MMTAANPKKTVQTLPTINRLCYVARYGVVHSRVAPCRNRIYQKHKTTWPTWFPPRAELAVEIDQIASTYFNVMALPSGFAT